LVSLRIRIVLEGVVARSTLTAPHLHLGFYRCIARCRPIQHCSGIGVFNSHPLGYMSRRCTSKARHSSATSLGRERDRPVCFSVRRKRWRTVLPAPASPDTTNARLSPARTASINRSTDPALGVTVNQLHRPPRTVKSPPSAPDVATTLPSVGQDAVELRAWRTPYVGGTGRRAR